LVQTVDGNHLNVSSRPAFLWRAAGPAGFEIRQWDGEAVLYGLASGETHALSPVHTACVLTLMEQPAAREPAAYWLAAMSAGEAAGATPDIQDPAELDELTRVLTDLHGIGVVERISA
jgi:hypothetical protein